MEKWQPTYIEHLYIGERAGHYLEQIYRAVGRGTTIPELYLITFASNDVEQLDIISAKYLLKPKIREKLPTIVGVAITKKEAYQLVEQMAHDSYLATGKCDLCAYLNQREQTRE